MVNIINFKQTFLLIILLIIGHLLIAQNDQKANHSLANNKESNYKGSIKEFPFDYNDTLFQEIKNNHFSFLISDSIYYKFTIDEIYKFNNGYGLQLSTKISDIDVIAFLVSMKSSEISGKKIKKGCSYNLKLSRYFEKPLSRSIEYPQFYDVMLGQNMVGILSIGYSYIFISQNINGLNYIDSASVFKTEKRIKENEDKISEFAFSYFKSLIYEKDTNFLIANTDTVLIRKCLSRYSKLFGPNMTHNLLHSPPSKVELLQWENFKIDTTNFFQFYWGMLNYFYSLPIQYSEITRLSQNDFAVKVLHFSDNIYTIRVKWKLSSKKQIYTAILE